MRTILIAVMACLITWPCLASDEDTISAVAGDGSVIIMQSGQVYGSDDPSTSASWQPGEDVVITDDKIINTDEGESVETEQ